ncbi:hypothetical protein [Thermococcus sp. AM4]|uniref:hypothetical protein n=1 Tax=Thermococcus sp. (strain AM4) TaxID=246969 RepID=UPI0001870D15|nr:hypothetical protein [Thermococcus sp. AM4]EEB73227.1 hypothetical protein TAM4_2084 [Thermococcus sp. AM4]
MPYDEIIPDEYSGGKIKQAILLMKVIFIMPIILLSLIFAWWDGLFLSDRLAVMAILSPTFYIGLTGIPSIRDVKENPWETVDRMFSFFNVVPFLTILVLYFSGEIKSLPEPLGGILFLLSPLILSHLYYQLVRRITEKGIPFALLMLTPAISTALTFPPLLAYLPAFLPPYLIKLGLDHLEDPF